MIKIGAGWCPAMCGFSEQELCKAMAEAGFHSVDYDLILNYDSELWSISDSELKKKMEQKRKVIQDNGLIVGQTHSPLDAYWGSHQETKYERWKAKIQAIKATAFLGAPYIVIHPLLTPYRLNETVREEVKQLNMEYYNYLEPYLKEYNVKAAIENIFSRNPELNRPCKTAHSRVKDLKDYIDTLDSDRFVVCLDVGHATLTEQDPVEMIYELGNQYLKVTHIHDNSFWEDHHLIPGAGKLDWYAIGKALNDIEFDGVFNYEANRSYTRLGMFAEQLSPELLKVYGALAHAIVNEGK